MAVTDTPSTVTGAPGEVGDGFVVEDGDVVDTVLGGELGGRSTTAVGEGGVVDGGVVGFAIDVEVDDVVDVVAGGAVVEVEVVVVEVVEVGVVDVVDGGAVVVVVGLVVVVELVVVEETDTSETTRPKQTGRMESKMSSLGSSA